MLEEYECSMVGNVEKEILDSIGLERLTYIAKGTRKDFDQIWVSYMNIT